ncbi:MAG: hypothetical protein Q8L56_13785 [Rhodocyclaceae bacterium]|nr:hypothetical protein [Rhodocyclaceae bacterium]
MSRALKSFFRSFADLLVSESGELLSTRRKAHLLQNKMYSRLGRKHKPGTDQ